MVSLREKEILKILKEFRERTDIICSTLFNDDGLIIAVEQAHLTEDEDYYQSIGAICAAIVALAEQGVETIKQDNGIKHVTIQAGDQLDKEGFSIILESVTNDILLSVVFPIFLNLGVIQFELNQTIQKLSKYFSSVEQKENLGHASSLE